MNEQQTLEVINKIFATIFGQKNPYTLDEIFNKFAFDIVLPQKVHDSTTHEEAWTDSPTSSKFITQANMERHENTIGWTVKKREVHNLDEIISLWNRLNMRTTDKVFDGINVHKSDSIHGAENVYNCVDSGKAKNIAFCRSCGDCSFLLACQRTALSDFCIRVDDTFYCTNSYCVSSSKKVANSMFIQDCFDIYECMFCAHLRGKRYYIANMPFEKEEYFAIKKLVIDWILKS